MGRVSKWVSANHRELILGILCAAVFIVFEAYQQLFYARNFSVSGGTAASFFTILSTGLNRWLIWAALSPILIFYTLKNPIKRGNLRSGNLFKYLVVIIAVLFLNLVSVSVLFIVLDSGAMNWASFEETFVFYFFHKTPLYFITLVALVVLIHFFRNREVLDLTIGELGKLKFSHEQLYQELRNQSLKDESFVLQVKTGPRTKLVPVEEIVWIEADDYCVRIHDHNDNSHTLRSSMKALSEKLDHYGFLRVHRKAIVNMSFVSEFVQNGRIEIVLRNGQTIPVAQSRLSELKSALQTI